VAIIPLAQTLPFGSSDLPGGFGRAARFWISNFKSEISKCLPIWSCTARSLPGRACHHARRCALTHFKSEISNLKLAHGGRTVSPITWFEPEISIRNLKPNRGWSVLCCTCRRQTSFLKFQIWNL